MLRGNVKVARLLLEHGAQANLQDLDGKVPLHKSCELGDLEMTMLLVEFNASATIADKVIKMYR